MQYISYILKGLTRIKKTFIELSLSKLGTLVRGREEERQCPANDPEACSLTGKRITVFIQEMLQGCREGSVYTAQEKHNVG